MSERTSDAARSHFCRTLPFGAQLTGLTRAQFRFWAPSVEHVQLEIDTQTPLEMTPSGGGWFEIEADCQAGDLYRFRVSDDLAVPDPASRFQPDGVHGYSEIVCPTRFEWQHPDWQGRPWEETVLYELHVGAYGDGRGYRGVMEKLPALHALGITAIELMPLNSFPGKRNWGYDGVLPFAPEASYGSPDELKQLIDTAHGLGIMVFLDVVYNHFGPDGNFLHAYAEPFFKAGTHTPWGPAIDFDKPEVRDYFFENALYWLLEYRFDGLRLDAVHALNNDSWLRELSERVQSSVEHGRHVHLVLENERNTSSLLVHHFQAQWSDDAHNTMHVLLTGETESYYEAFATSPVQKLARVLSEGFVYQGEPSPIHEGAPRGEPSGSLPPTAFVFFLQNHDQIGNRAFGERLRSLTDDDSLRAATLLMLLSPQIPMLFMGEESGSTQPFYFFTGYTGDLATAVREGRRKEFSKNAAFSDAEQREKIPDPNHIDTFHASSIVASATGQGDADATGQTDEADDAGAWRTFYRDMLRLRRQRIMPGLHQPVHSLGAEVFGDAIVARWRLSDGQMLTIAVNLSATDATVTGASAACLNGLQQEAIAEVPGGAADKVRTSTVPAKSCVVLLSAENPITNDEAYAHAGNTAPQIDTRTNSSANAASNSASKAAPNTGTES